MRGFLRRLLPWLAPPATIYLCLVIGHAVLGHPPALAEVVPEAPDPPQPLDTTHPEIRELRIPIRDADGRPAVDAVVALLEPEPAAAAAGEDGVAVLRVRAPGPYRMLLWAPGHVRLQPPPFAVPPAEGFELASLVAPTIPRPAGLELLDRRLELLDAGDGAPLSGCITTASGPTEGESWNWIDVSRSDGEVVLRGTRGERLSVSVFAPGMPPDPAWRIAELSLGPSEATTQPRVVPIECVRLQVEDLEPHALLEGWRLDPESPLPVRAADAAGRATYAELPPGRYRFRSGDWEREVELAPGNALLSPSEA